MAKAAEQPKTDLIIGFIGIRGRNGSDPSLIIPDGQCTEARNVDWYQSSLGRKRGGALAVAITGGTAFGSGVRSIFRHVAGADQGTAELWGFDGAGLVKRLTGGTSWANITLLDAITGNYDDINAVSFNGKLFVACNTAHNRLHVWDPSDAVAKLRRVGLDKPGTPANPTLSGGAVTDTRKYRVSWTVQKSSVTVLRSNLSDPTAATGLAAQRATVTQPTPPGEGETHWELWGAATASSYGDYRLIATTAIATTTAEDNNATLPTTTAPDEGKNTPPPSAKYMVADDARIIMAGAWETVPENATAPKNSRVWWTSILGASDVGDDERVSNTGTFNNYADLEEPIVGISQPFQLTSAQASSLDRGAFYVFSFLSQWKFVSTGDADDPYLKFRITGGSGCIDHKTIVTGQDIDGNPAIYWLSPAGPTRITANGQEFLGQDILDIWDRVNLDATTKVAHGLYYPDLHQIWWWVAVDGSNTPNFRIVYDVRLGKATAAEGIRFGWSTADGNSTKAYCSCLFSDTIAASMGRRLKPFIGYVTSTAVWKCETGTDDAGTPFQAYIDSKSYVQWGLGSFGGMTKDAVLCANAAPGVEIQLTTQRNEEAESLYSSADLTPRSDSAAEVLVFPQFEGSRVSESATIRFRIGDRNAIANSWNLVGVIAPVDAQGDI